MGGNIEERTCFIKIIDGCFKFASVSLQISSQINHFPAFDVLCEFYVSILDFFAEQWQ